ncbi:MAG TPA: LPS assembly lipoprotein LptE [Hyphomicrobiales bacterium]|nr:LPS assembly lipoprotein LptE [Hyphomicrobiales bacterium]
MSLLECRNLMFAKRVFAAIGMISLLALSGCGWKPLYGTTASGADLQDVMRSVEIATIPGRVGQQVRNELIFDTTGGGTVGVPEYRLDIAIRESVLNTLVANTGDPQSQTYQLYTQFKLVRLSDNQVVLKGNSNARAAYDKVDSVFADIRARRDAENRAAKTIADAVRLRMAAFLSSEA